MRKSDIDHTGERYGSWTIKSKTIKKKVFAQCDCGSIFERDVYSILNGKSTNCGCIQNIKTKERMTTHGKSSKKIYKVWRSMLVRCNNKNSKSYKDYGGRGIFVCDEWKTSFENFYSWATENGYKEGLEIDRINNDKEYSPNNCRIVNREDNANNKRNTRMITINNETKTAKEWSEISGISRRLIIDRFHKGWREEDLLIPKQSNGNQYTVTHKDKSW